MKLQIVITSLLVAASAFAQNTAAPQSFALPVVPPGTNSAAYALPRQDWIQRVMATNARAHEVAGDIQLVFDGDSITDFWQGIGKQVWAERYGNLHAFDFGISGDRTQNVLWRLGQGQVDGIHPKLIALMIGTNNMWSNSVEEIAEGVKAIVQEYQKRCPEAVILLQAIFPRGEKASDPLRAKVKAANEIISKLGDGKKIVYIDFGAKFLDAEGNMPREIMPDFLHPSAQGYQIWADAIQPLIDQYCPAKP
jgi:beta-glucosidase